MSLTSGFFNSVNGDRTYNADQFTSMFDGVVIDGVFGSYGDSFNVTPGSGLGVIVGTGRAWFNHTWSYNDAPINIALASASSSGSRYDAIVLKVDTTDTVRANSIEVISGSTAVSPVKPHWTVL